MQANPLGPVVFNVEPVLHLSGPPSPPDPPDPEVIRAARDSLNVAERMTYTAKANATLHRLQAVWGISNTDQAMEFLASLARGADEAAKAAAAAAAEAKIFIVNLCDDLK